MTDAPESRVPGPTRPTLAAKVVGGLQWAVTASYVFLLGLLAATWYLHLTRTPASVDLSRPFAAVVVTAFAAGYAWVATRPAAPGAHDRRIEVVVTLLVLGFLFPFAVPGLLDLTGVAPPVPNLGFGLAYALALAVSYGLVYGLGVRFFLGPRSAEPREP
ncbi:MULTISPECIES: hypothetical protein [Halorussus]|uniref:hypothetical protein n=1 Tax=Halorussus TaxID=1070314 RepID=UPI000E216463|nr:MULTISPECIES: hypothetical protein [Halorussus]NHN60921.1 hypothetical protein [Halorussus sp. JP-T4]